MGATVGRPKWHNGSNLPRFAREITGIIRSSLRSGHKIALTSLASLSDVSSISRDDLLDIT